jgi:hypothetical protein
LSRSRAAAYQSITWTWAFSMVLLPVQRARTVTIAG